MLKKANMVNYLLRFFCLIVFILGIISCSADNSNKLGNRLFVIERASKTIAVVDMEKLKLIKRFKLTANLHHASMKFGSGLQYGYIASRNGVLSRINLETLKEDGYIITAKNSIGSAISQDGKTIAVSNYKPGGITFVNTKTFTIINTIPAVYTNKDGHKAISRITGIVDGPNNTFICALMDHNEIWIMAKVKDKNTYYIKKKIKTSIKKPFDGLITPEGRYYITAHFKSDRVSLVDLWNINNKAKPIFFRKHPIPKNVPVKLLHLESWAVAGNKIFIPSVGEKRVSVLSSSDFSYKGSINLIGYPVYAMVHPNQKELWVTFSGKKNDGKIQIINTVDNKTKKVIDVGKRVYHLIFTPRGHRAYISSNGTNELVVIDCINHSIIKKISLNSPAGIFGVWRAFQIGL